MGCGSLSREREQKEKKRTEKWDGGSGMVDVGGDVDPKARGLHSVDTKWKQGASISLMLPPRMNDNDTSTASAHTYEVPYEATSSLSRQSRDPDHLGVLQVSWPRTCCKSDRPNKGNSMEHKSLETPRPPISAV